MACADETNPAALVAVKVLAAASAALVVAACGSPTVVDTGEPWTPINPTTAPPGLPEQSTDQLADATEFYITEDGRNAYYFTSPSGRWRCAIVPRVSAGCQPVNAASLPMTGVPTTVPDADGEPTAPNTILIEQSTPVRFADQDARLYTPASGPAATLPFDKVLTVAGFRCNVQEATGISCGSEGSGKGFTFSAEAYTAVYTDVMTR